MSQLKVTEVWQYLALAAKNWLSFICLSLRNLYLYDYDSWSCRKTENIT